MLFVQSLEKTQVTVSQCRVADTELAKQVGQRSGQRVASSEQRQRCHIGGWSAIASLLALKSWGTRAYPARLQHEQSSGHRSLTVAAIPFHPYQRKVSSILLLIFVFILIFTDFLRRPFLFWEFCSNKLSLRYFVEFSNFDEFEQVQYKLDFPIFRYITL